ncbi:MAG: class I SAM-dependent methyltransferase [Methylicorpusculum sp.]|uniref:class I SAM-dependent methyltransferase n=1 Tax=Methylicorpusculum sp. TaxID=2713644 RepID=UPI002717194F|nr:class I SAM-dependent methyltransferase [Methylicorpusculum sp.]MDO8941122.1 class I SAM-dependent methyltransferase [Methylicorpusculum sp.]MDP2204583.1 class I SAM-dependent methyltransferase [Methylicorpusculum sp.]
MTLSYRGKLAVLYEGQGDLAIYQQLAERLLVPLRSTATPGFDPHELFFLSWREGSLKLIDRQLLRKGGMTVEIEPRPGEQRSWPAPKTGALAQAIGRKTKTVIDATTGWGQDSLHIFRMGYELRCIERSPVMLELLADAFTRLTQLDWVSRLKLEPPELIPGNAIAVLSELEQAPDCIYLDPMFPPKRKKSALAKKSMTVLRDLLGDDEDKDQLFAAAMKATAKKVVVKSPDDVEPLGGAPHESFSGKLLRYDVYLKV